MLPAAAVSEQFKCVELETYQRLTFQTTCRRIDVVYRKRRRRRRRRSTFIMPQRPYGRPPASPLDLPRDPRLYRNIAAQFRGKASPFSCYFLQSKRRFASDSFAAKLHQKHVLFSPLTSSQLNITCSDMKPKKTTDCAS